MNVTKTNFQPGDIVSTPKFPGVDHLGIVISDKLIAHNSPTNGIVLATYEEFSNKGKIDFKRRSKNPRIVMNRALALTNKGIEYDLFVRNCEHFVTHCENETAPNSPQLKLGLALVAMLAIIVVTK